MGICKEECLYFEVCNSWHKELKEEGLIMCEFVQHKCKDFKNKADFQELKHGEWEYVCEYKHKKYYRCSVCRHSYSIYENTQYCQHCGAKMEGVNNDN